MYMYVIDVCWGEFVSSSLPILLGDWCPVVVAALCGSARDVIAVLLVSGQEEDDAGGGDR